MAPPEAIVGAAAGAVITLGVSLLGGALGGRKNGKDKTVSDATSESTRLPYRCRCVERFQAGIYLQKACLM
jgi:hypothetical protein